ncbi:hypothetical protein AB0K00_01985 [Dactylosporangium sp. NPDC049525]|uniref:hypothetical protein n=1 Tax=Dactylosporangium sp. NPDC049525 TaxID=3154730 RepID=UPI00343864E1
MTVRGISRAVLLTIVAAVTVLSAGAVALAAWGVPATGLKLAAQAGTLPAGPAPVATSSVNGVRISWTPVQIPNVAYRVSRHAAGAPVVGVCLTGETTCVDGSASSGRSYTYSLRLVVGSWQGAESAPSDDVTIPAAKVTAGESGKQQTPSASASPGPAPTPTTSPSAAASPTMSTPASTPPQPSEPATPSEAEGGDDGHP